MNQPPVAPPRRSGRAVVRHGLPALVALLVLVGLSLVAGAQPVAAAEPRLPVSSAQDGAPEAQTEEGVGATTAASRARSAARPYGRAAGTAPEPPAAAPGRALPAAPRPAAVLRCVVLRC
ncbi:hypothetical protein ACWDR0_09405 [Streptomyces sp. NPDC003691]